VVSESGTTIHETPLLIVNGGIGCNWTNYRDVICMSTSCGYISSSEVDCHSNWHRSWPITGELISEWISFVLVCDISYLPPPQGGYSPLPLDVPPIYRENWGVR
jgi:hypothetical protein